jgi:hypothetical protein
LVVRDFTNRFNAIQELDGSVLENFLLILEKFLREWFAHDPSHFQRWFGFLHRDHVVDLETPTLAGMNRMFLTPWSFLSIVTGPGILRDFNELNVDLFRCESKDGTLRLVTCKPWSTIDFVLAVNSLRYLARRQIDGKWNFGEPRQKRTWKVPRGAKVEPVKDAIQKITTDDQPNTLSKGKLRDVNI